jgi:hypothetical protein
MSVNSTKSPIPSRKVVSGAQAAPSPSPSPSPTPAPIPEISTNDSPSVSQLRNNLFKDKPLPLPGRMPLGKVGKTMPAGALKEAIDSANKLNSAQPEESKSSLDLAEPISKPKPGNVARLAATGTFRLPGMGPPPKFAKPPDAPLPETPSTSSEETPAEVQKPVNDLLLMRASIKVKRKNPSKLMSKPILAEIDFQERIKILDKQDEEKKDVQRISLGETSSIVEEPLANANKDLFPEAEPKADVVSVQKLVTREPDLQERLGDNIIATKEVEKTTVVSPEVYVSVVAITSKVENECKVRDEHPEVHLDNSSKRCSDSAQQTLEANSLLKSTSASPGPSKSDTKGDSKTEGSLERKSNSPPQDSFNGTSVPQLPDQVSRQSKQEKTEKSFSSCKFFESPLRAQIYQPQVSYCRKPQHRHQL